MQNHFSYELINWYSKNKRDLPWRKTKNPYIIWLSEIMLQQTRVTQGLPYFYKFTEVFPTIFDLANAEESTVLKLWQGLGYYSRARNLHFTAKYISYELKGKFPNNYKDLLKLKGVGDYTASAIASICFKEPTPVVDGNVYRVLARYFGINTPINSTQGKKDFKELAQKLIDKDKIDIYNQAIMDFGALQCKPQNPNCHICVFSSSCEALKNNLVKELPVKQKTTKIKNRFFNYLFILLEDKTVLQERKGKDIWQGLYELPLIETKKSINEPDLLFSEDFIRLFPKKTEISLFNKVDILHKLSHQHLHTKFWIIKTSEVVAPLIPVEEIKKYPTSVLVANFLDKYLN